MAQTGSRTEPSRSAAARGRGRRGRLRALLLLTAGLGVALVVAAVTVAFGDEPDAVVAPAVAPAAVAPAPENLRIIPRVEALVVRWSVSSTEGLQGFRVRWRPVGGTWSRPVERPASARGYKISGLAVEPYEVRVRTILAEGAVGPAVSGEGTPLPPETEEHEGESEEPPEGTTLPRAPAGVPAPTGGWNVVLADAFAAPIGGGAGEDKLWRLPEEFQHGFNSDELEVWSPSQVNTVSTGLDLACKRQLNAGGTGKNFLCGFVNTKGHFNIRSYAGSTFALECVCRWPMNTGEADPGWWQDGQELGIEQEIDDFEGFGWHSDGSWEYGAGIPVALGLDEYDISHIEGVDAAFGFDPTGGFHRYTTVIKPAPFGHTEFAEYIDGVFRWRFHVLTPPISIWQHLILSYALREYPQNFTSGTRHFDIRSVEVFQDAAHNGQDVSGGGIAPGTKLAP